MKLTLKILILFIVGFGIMSLLVLGRLHFGLRQEFQAVERQLATDQIDQLTQNLNGELERLSQTSEDWSNWDDMYNYALHPNKEFTERHIAPISLKEIEIKFLAILDNHGNTIFSESVNLMNAKLENGAAFNRPLEILHRYIARTNQAPEKSCGLAMTGAGPVFLCWEPIRKSDYSENPSGTLIIARLFNASLANKIKSKSNIQFELEALDGKEPNAMPSKNVPIKAENLEFSESEPGILTAQYNDFLGQPVIKVKLKYSNKITQQGEQLGKESAREILIVAIITALILMGGIYLLAVHRLQNITVETKRIWRNARWAERLHASHWKDELEDVTHTINRMLALIRKQSIILEAITHTDSLTQIANHALYEQRLQVELAFHRRNRTPLGLILVEIDHFDLYIDQYGQPACDEMLIKIAKILGLVACRPSDLAARIGPAQFAIILPATNRIGANHVAESLQKRLEDEKILHQNSPTSDYVTVSIGVAEAGNEDFGAFAERAKHALDESKLSVINKLTLAD